MVTFAVYILLRSRTSGPEITQAKMSCWIQSRSITVQSRVRSKISQCHTFHTFHETDKKMSPTILDTNELITIQLDISKFKCQAELLPSITMHNDINGFHIVM